MSLQQMKNKGGISPLFLIKISYLNFIKVLILSFFIQIILIFFVEIEIENEIKINFWEKKEIDLKSIENFYISKENVLKVKCLKENDYLIIKYWTKGFHKYITPPKEIEIGKPKVIYLSRNMISSVFSSANLFIFLFSLQISLILFNLFSIIKKKNDFSIFEKIKIDILLYSILCAGILIISGFLYEIIIPKTYSEYIFNAIKETGIKDKLIFLIIGSVIAPLNEEIFFRGIVLGRFLKYDFKTYGILVSSFLFAIFHFDLLSLPIIFIYGIFLSYFYIKSKSLLTPIISHMLNNFLFFLLTFC